LYRLNHLIKFEKKVVKISGSTSTLLLAVTLMVGCSNGESSKPSGESRCTSMEYDGYTYDLVQIGDQCWFAENLRNEHYANGDAIPGDLSNIDWSKAEDTNLGAQVIYNNDASNLTDYGRLYNWYAVDDARGLCPSGWHVPTDDEFTLLTDILRGIQYAGEAMKSSPTDSPSWNGTNTSGFSGLAGGSRNDVGDFYSGGDYGFFWSASSVSANGTNAWFRVLDGGNTEVNRNNYYQRSGFSVRCVRHLPAAPIRHLPAAPRSVEDDTKSDVKAKDCFGDRGCITEIRNLVSGTGYNIAAEEFMGQGIFYIDIFSYGNGKVESVTYVMDCDCEPIEVKIRSATRTNSSSEQLHRCGRSWSGSLYQGGVYGDYCGMECYVENYPN
jgi:uncharacterized protein (TIGR02145 family)